MGNDAQGVRGCPTQARREPCPRCGSEVLEVTASPLLRPDIGRWRSNLLGLSPSRLGRSDIGGADHGVEGTCWSVGKVTGPMDRESQVRLIIGTESRLAVSQYSCVSCSKSHPQCIETAIPQGPSQPKTISLAIRSPTLELVFFGDRNSPKFVPPSVFQIIQMRYRVYSRC
jgi:hypothetical protein